MTDTTTTQTAADTTNPPATPGGAEPGAQTDGDALDKLLKEFDSQTAPATATTNPPAPQQDTGADLKTIADEVRALRTERQQETFNRDMADTVGKIRGDLDPEVFDDALVRGYVDARAGQDPRLAQAWVNRHTNPKAFNRVVDQIGREFRDKFSKLPDRAATEDHAAVTAAVRGTSTKAPEGKAPNYAGLSNPEYREAIKRDYGFDPGVG